MKFQPPACFSLSQSLFFVELNLGLFEQCYIQF